ncbi:DUF4260 domain-containing protein [Devosia lucknowensis]|nr:DUF4260 domain-containing protein [Devosia lucknowensis]
MPSTVVWQRVEGALIFVAGLALFGVSGSGLPWWAALALFFLPDLSFAAYFLGPKIGARIYNFVHVYALGAVLMALGSLLDNSLLVGLGALLLSHSGFDRMFGYGLKAETSFEDTHLGRIGKRG